MVSSAKVIAIHFGVMIPLQALAVIAVLLRLYTRLFITKLRLGIEDYFVGITCIIAGACALAIAVADVYFGEGLILGSSEQDIRKTISLYQTQYATSILYAIEAWCLKTAVLLLYRRIFALPRFIQLCNALLVFIFVSNLATFIGSIFLCWPIDQFWLQAVPGHKQAAAGKCVNFRALWISFGAINIATDFLAVALPVPVLRNLHTQTRKRKFLMGIFALSILPCFASIIRVYSLRHINGQNLGQHIWEHDLWCGVEMALGLVCACLPTLTPFAARHFPCLLTGISDARQTPAQTPRHRRHDDAGEGAPDGAIQLKAHGITVLARAFGGGGGSSSGGKSGGLKRPNLWGSSTLMQTEEEPNESEIVLAPLPPASTAVGTMASMTTGGSTSSREEVRSLEHPVSDLEKAGGENEVRVDVANGVSWYHGDSVSRSSSGCG